MRLLTTMMIIGALLAGSAMAGEAESLEQAARCEQAVLAGDLKGARKLLIQLPDTWLFGVKRELWQSNAAQAVVKSESTKGQEQLLWLNWSVRLLHAKDPDLARRQALRFRNLHQRLSESEAAMLKPFLFGNESEALLRPPARPQPVVAPEKRFADAIEQLRLLKFHPSAAVFTQLQSEGFRPQETQALAALARLAADPEQLRPTQALLKDLKEPAALALVHAALGQHATFVECDFRAATASFTQALALPGDQDLLHRVLQVPFTLAVLHHHARRYDQAREAYLLDAQQPFDGRYNEVYQLIDMCKKKGVPPFLPGEAPGLPRHSRLLPRQRFPHQPQVRPRQSTLRRRLSRQTQRNCRRLQGDYRRSPGLRPH